MIDVTKEQEGGGDIETTETRNRRAMETAETRETRRQHKREQRRSRRAADTARERRGASTSGIGEGVGGRQRRLRLGR